MIVPQRLTKFRAWIVDKREADQAPLTMLSPEVFRHLSEACLALEPRIAYDHEPLTAIGQAHPECPRLHTIPGIDP